MCMEQFVIENKSNEDIYNSFLKCIYLSVLFVVKNHEIAKDILFRSFEKVILFDYHFYNFKGLKVKLNENISISMKKFMMLNPSIQDSLFDYNIPDEIYLLNFNIYKFFNDLDNKIIIGLLFMDKNSKELSSVIGIDEQALIERFKVLIKHIKVTCFDNVKNIFYKQKVG